MKPQNVEKHEHFFAYLDEESLPIDDIAGRFDACLTRDDGSGVWSPETGKWYPQPSYAQAVAVAKEMAVLYAKMNPLEKDK